MPSGEAEGFCAWNLKQLVITTQRSSVVPEAEQPADTLHRPGLSSDLGPQASHCCWEAQGKTAHASPAALIAERFRDLKLKPRSTRQEDSTSPPVSAGHTQFFRNLPSFW